VPFHLFLINWW